MAFSFFSINESDFDIITTIVGVQHSWAAVNLK